MWIKSLNSIINMDHYSYVGKSDKKVWFILLNGDKLHIPCGTEENAEKAYTRIINALRNGAIYVDVSEYTEDV